MKKCLDLSSFSLSSPTFVMNVFSISTGTMLMTLTSDATESSCTIGGILAFAPYAPYAPGLCWSGSYIIPISDAFAGKPIAMAYNGGSS